MSRKVYSFEEAMALAKARSERLQQESRLDFLAMYVAGREAIETSGMSSDLKAQELLALRRRFEVLAPELGWEMT